MNELVIVGLVVPWFFIGAGCWLGWQLLRQNGRMLLRIEEVERRRDVLEFGEENEQRTLINAEGNIASQLDVGADALAELTDAGSEIRNPEAEIDNRVARFSNRSLARSRIKRDGLKTGTSAPNFRLPRVDGRGEWSLGELRGRRVLLVFSDPHCGPCQTLAPQLEAFHREQREVSVVLISRGDPKENRTKIKERGLTFPVLLQQHWEISRRYAMFATPMAYLIDEAGITARGAAVGVEPILTLMADAKTGRL